MKIGKKADFPVLRNGRAAFFFNKGNISAMYLTREGEVFQLLSAVSVK